MAPSAPRAMILAAGFGTRLGALSQARPKPMLPVCGAPLVRWAVRWLAHHGIEDIAINLHHLGEQIEAELGEGRDLGVRIRYSPEHGQILGTGGGLRQARPWIDDGHDGPVVIVNGKILIELDLQQVLAEHQARGAEATMVLRPDPQGAWGRPLRVDGDGRLVEMLGQQRPDPRGAVSEALMFTGVHVIQPRFLDRIPAQGEQCVVRTAYRELFERGQGLYGHLHRQYWWEHSTPERYRQGVFNLLDGQATLPYAEHPTSGVLPGAEVEAGANVLPPVWIGPGVRVERGASVGPHVQLGAGVRVRSGVRLQRTVVWDGVDVQGDAEDTVIVA